MTYLVVPGRFEVGEPQDVEKLGAGSRPERVKAAYVAGCRADRVSSHEEPTPVV
jgi:hypothetical protein